jgi:uncharacterized membrane protein YfcA
MLCSIVVQVIGLVRLRASVECRACGSFVVGGLIGAPVAVWLLTHLDAANLRAAFGVFLLIYTGHTYLGLMRARRGLVAAGVPFAAKPVSTTPPGALASGGIGLLSGFIGGLTAMPGAVLSAWCDMAGYDKARQRGMVQPFILAMQITALVWIVGAGSVLDRGMVEDLLRSLPALLAGVALGLAVYARMNAAMFRQTVLAMIAASGLSLAVL